MVLLGNFTSLDGDEFTPYCTEALGNNWQAKAAAMIPGLNSMIGQDMCTYMDVVTGDIRIVSLSSQLKATGTAVSVPNYYTHILRCTLLVQTLQRYSVCGAVIIKSFFQRFIPRVEI